MELEELLAMIEEYAIEKGLSRPRRVHIAFDDQADNIDVPVRASKGRRVKKAAKREERDDTPGTAVDALRIAIFEAGQRQSGGQLAGFVLERWGQWKYETLVSAASEEGKKLDGRIRLHLKDPGDGYGKGYGLAEWDS